MTERRALGGEVRALSGTRISGVAMRYGATGIIPGGLRERFLPGAFSPVPSTIPLTLQHDEASPVGEMELTDTATELRAEGDVTRAAHDLIRRGALRGYSVEFGRADDAIIPAYGSSIREVRSAKLLGLSVVDRPAYSTAEVEARQRLGGPSLETRIRPSLGMMCKCADKGATGATVREVEFSPRAFDRIVEEVADGTRSVKAITRGADSVVASTAGGTLELAVVGGGLSITMQLIDTAAGRDLQSLQEEGENIYARPVWTDASEFEIDGERAYITDAEFSYILVRPLPEEDAEGLDPLVARENRRALPWARRRMLLA